MYESSEYRHSQSGGERGGGKTIQIPNDQLRMYGSHVGEVVGRGRRRDY